MLSINRRKNVGSPNNDSDDNKRIRHFEHQSI